ncbi:MAG: hypothetical protein IT509_13575, partial [Rhodocyclaceae bacterium]|nr:hypothetical protein [Rhodocyclaceae bacterium]
DEGLEAVGQRDVHRTHDGRLRCLAKFGNSHHDQGMRSMSNPFDCLRYWDLSSRIRLDDAIALWCNVDPAQLASLGFDTQCMSAKRAALVTALREGRLEYEDLGIVTGHGKVFKGAPVDELLEKNRLVIDKASLRRWFEQLPFEDRPAFLFDESRQPVLPDGSNVTEMTSSKALALMATLLARASPRYRIGDRPNSDAIAKAAQEAAAELMPGNDRGLLALHKRIAAALKSHGPEIRTHRIS